MSFIINVSCKNTYLQNGLRFPILALVFFFLNVITFFHENIPLPFKPFLYLSIWWIPIYHSWASLQSLSLSSCFLSHSRHSCLRSLLWSHVIFLTDLLSYGFFHISLAVYKLSLPQIQSWKERKNHSMLISESWQFSSKPKQSRCSICGLSFSFLPLSFCFGSYSFQVMKSGVQLYLWLYINYI